MHCGMSLRMPRLRLKWEYWSERLRIDSTRNGCHVAAHQRLVTEVPELLEDFRRVELECERLRADAVASDRRRRDLFDQIPLACVLTDPYGVIQEANRDAALLLRCRVRGLSGTPLLLFVADRDAFSARLEQIARGVSRVEADVQLQPRDHPLVECHLIGRRADGIDRALWRWFLVPYRTMAREAATENALVTR